MVTGSSDLSQVTTILALTMDQYYIGSFLKAEVMSGILV